jgi:hypothetical protein
MWWFARGLWDGGRVVMDDVVQVDRDHGFHERQERMNWWW